jgi:cell division protein FtsW (lipid II flippase)
VAGIILPTLIVSGLFFIPFSPFFDNVTTSDANQWFRRKPIRMAIATAFILALSVLLVRVHAWDALLPALLVTILLLFATESAAQPARGVGSWLSSRPISFWIMTLFLMEAVVLTAVGTLFRGPSWAWVWPWRG